MYGNMWGGLEFNNQNSLMDGCFEDTGLTPDCWWYAVGSFHDYVTFGQIFQSEMVLQAGKANLL